MLITAKPETISEISRDIAQVFFAALVVGQVLTPDRNWVAALAGFLLSVGFWYVSALLARK